MSSVATMAGKISHRPGNTLELIWSQSKKQLSMDGWTFSRPQQPVVGKLVKMVGKFTACSL